MSMDDRMNHTLRVFVSHTREFGAFPEPNSFVESAKSAIIEAGMLPVEQKHFAATDLSGAASSIAALEDCDAWIGIIGFRYGTIVPERATFSHVELEYNRARELSLPIRAFLLDEEKPVPEIPVRELFDVAASLGTREKQIAFRERIQREVTSAYFSTSDTLWRKVYQGLIAISRPSSVARGHPAQIPFFRNSKFVGRESELQALAALMKSKNDRDARTVIAGVVGLGGVGKTQLLVEYAFRNVSDYSGGVFWLQGSESLDLGLARIGRNLATSSRIDSTEELVRRAIGYLNENPACLVVIDDILDPRELLRPTDGSVVVANLGCALLYSSRRHSSGHFPEVPIGALDEYAALELLLSGRRDTPLRETEEQAAMRICKTLGMLPLALVMASAHLSLIQADQFGRYAESLVRHGALPVLDSTPSPISALDLSTRHEPAMRATLLSQWETVHAEDSARAMAALVALGPGAIISTSMWRIICEAPETTPVDGIAVAFAELKVKCLVESLPIDAVRIHPLVHELCLQLMPDRIVSAADRGLNTAASYLQDASHLTAALTGQGVQFVVRDVASLIEGARWCAGRGESDLQSVVEALTRLRDVLTREIRWVDRPADSTCDEYLRQIAVSAERSGLQVLSDTAVCELQRLDLICYNTKGLTQDLNEDRLASLDLHSSGITAFARGNSEGSIVVSTRDGLVALLDTNLLGIDHVLAQCSTTVRCLAAQECGPYLATGCDDGSIIVVDLSINAITARWVAHLGSVRGLRFALNDQLLVSVSHDGFIRTWRCDTWEESASVETVEAGAEAIAVRGRRALIAQRDGSVSLWSLEPLKPLATYSIDDSWIESVVWESEDTFVASTLSGLVARWSIESNRALLEQRAIGRVTALTALANGGLAVGDSNGYVEVWTSQVPHRRRVHNARGSRVTALIDAGGDSVLCGGSDGRLRTVPVRSGVELGQDRGERIRLLCCDRSGNRVAVLAGGDVRPLTDLAVPWTAHLDSNFGEVTALALHEELIAVGGKTGRVALLDWKSGDPISQHQSHTSRVNSLVFDDVGTLWSAGDDGQVGFWREGHGFQASRANANRRPVRALVARPVVGGVVSGSLDGSVYIHDPSDERGSLVGECLGAVGSVGFSCLGEALWVASRDGRIRAWTLEKEDVAWSQLVREGTVERLAFSKDGRWVAAACRGGVVLTWENQTRPCFVTSTSFESPLAAIWFDPSSTVLCSLTTGGSLFMNGLVSKKSYPRTELHSRIRLTVPHKDSGVVFCDEENRVAFLRPITPSPAPRTEAAS